MELDLETRRKFFTLIEERRKVVEATLDCWGVYAPDWGFETIVEDITGVSFDEYEAVLRGEGPHRGLRVRRG